ncbi:PEP-CTERM/exosortase system-associated acyltransferase [Halomonas tibetensis]|uniref:PEP-CTERM/exosortase system-associated acyltransferase n=1 Tax=Halomonas tibetensis TaxID=2259590 RepID=A0ABV7B5Y8_9GAMM
MKAIPEVEPAALERKDLLRQFGEDFAFIIASNEEQKRQAFALRHDVFIKELGYEMHEDEEQMLEFDEHDHKAIHCLIRHKRTGVIAGCLRLIIPSKKDQEKGYLLPIELHGEDCLDHTTLRPKFLPKDQICEVSRLAIAREFREKKGENPALANHNFTSYEIKTFSIILIGLFLCTYTIVGLTEKRHVFAMMEPRLPRALSLSGFHFSKVSKTINYHGKRNAFYIDHSKAEKEIHQDLIQLYAKIQSELSLQIDETITTDTRNTQSA